MINAIPDSWKQKLRTQSRFNNDNDQYNTEASLTTKGITCKQSCSIFVKRKFKEPLANNRLRRLGVNELDEINEIHSPSFRMTKETKLSIFQFKIIHNILPHRVLLYKMKITDSDLCLYCGSQETLQHLLASCPLLRTFWSDVLTWWNSSSRCSILFDELKILYGYNPGDPRCLLLNYYILIAKFHIFRCKIDSKSPTFPAFMAFERKITRTQSGPRSKQDFTKIPNKNEFLPVQKFGISTRCLIKLCKNARGIKKPTRKAQFRLKEV